MYKKKQKKDTFCKFWVPGRVSSCDLFFLCFWKMLTGLPDKHDWKGALPVFCNGFS